MSILSNILGGGDLIKEIGETVRQVIPNPEAQREFDLKIAELADKAEQRETELNIAQTEVNKEEAKSSNLFVAGWRPAIGWICGAALGWTWMAAPLINWVAALAGVQVDAPALPPESIFPVVLGMLGISVSRTVEKSLGVATSVNGTVPQPVLPQKTGPAPSPTNVGVTEVEPAVVKKSKWF